MGNDPRAFLCASPTAYAHLSLNDGHSHGRAAELSSSTPPTAPTAAPPAGTSPAPLRPPAEAPPAGQELAP